MIGPCAWVDITRNIRSDLRERILTDKNAHGLLSKIIPWNQSRYVCREGSLQAILEAEQIYRQVMLAGEVAIVPTAV